MNNMQKIGRYATFVRGVLFVAIFVIQFLVLAGCATPAASSTSLPPTEAPTTLPPTEAPTATATSEPTPTSAPGEIGSGNQIGLGADFVAVPKDDLAGKMPPELLIAGGLKEWPKSYPYYSVTPHWLEFPAKASFAFANADSTEFVYGYTVALPDAKDQTRFDSSFVDEFYAKERLEVLIYTQDSARIKDLAVGDKSSGMTAKPVVHGFAWRFNMISFRVGSTGAFVFTLYPASADAPIDIVKLAQTYASTLK